MISMQYMLAPLQALLTNAAAMSLQFTPAHPITGDMLNMVNIDMEENKLETWIG